MTTKISVIIPAYNVGPFLAEAIGSVLAQTRAPDEIIIVDDCSTDDSLTVARRFSDPRLKILSTDKNSGSAVARNLGIANATGELIAFLDADDLWLKTHVETVAGLLDANPNAALAFASAEAFGIERWIWPMVIPAGVPVNCFWECIPRTIIPQTAVVIRRSALLNIGNYRTELRQSQDFDLFLRLAYHHCFVCTHEVTTRYRRHESSITWLRPKKALQGQYLARKLFWKENHATMPVESLARYESVLREVWSQRLAASAQRLDFDMLNFHMEQVDMIPGSAERHQQWYRQRRIDRMKPIWQRLPISLRVRLKKVFRTFGLVQDTVEPAVSAAEPRIDTVQSVIPVGQVAWRLSSSGPKQPSSF